MSELEKLIKKQKSKTAFPTWEVIEAIAEEINKLKTKPIERKTKIELKTPEKTGES